MTDKHVITIDFGPYVESVDRRYNADNGGTAPSVGNKGLMFNLHNVVKTLDFQLRAGRLSALNQLNEQEQKILKYVQDRPQQTEEDRQSDSAYIAMVEWGGELLVRWECLQAAFDSASNVFKEVTGKTWDLAAINAEFSKGSTTSTKKTAVGAAFEEALKRNKKTLAAVKTA